ncbi:MAG: mRNA interferase MazF [Thermoanaerobaculia bacterium]|nr:mRNA interferase MazF [Thermoanaerobaculia bacterium]
MVVLEPGAVVVLRFPFSDLSSSKARPAVVLAPSSASDWIVCQVTSNPFADTSSIEIGDSSFSNGNLRGKAYVRPLKLFTADHSIIAQRVGTLRSEVLRSVLEVLLNSLSSSLLT